MNPERSETGDGPSSFVGASSVRGRVRLALFLALLGSATYAASLAASLPAGFVAARLALPAAIIDVSGTVWNGQAILKRGYEVEWQVLPFRSLFHFALDVDWTVTGTDSALAGRASLWPASATTSVDGRLGWGLATLAVPDMTFACEGTLAVALPRVVIREDVQGASGTLRSGPLSCADPVATGAAPIALPPLTGTASMDGAGARLQITATAAPAVPLSDIAVADRILKVTVHPDGARLTGVLPTSGPITLEYPF